MLAQHLRGQTEVTLNYNYGLAGNATLQASVRIDILTNDYAIEGGLDKRSSLDSIQQAVFAASLAGKGPQLPYMIPMTNGANMNTVSGKPQKNWAFILYGFHKVK